MLSSGDRCFGCKHFEIEEPCADTELDLRKKKSWKPKNVHKMRKCCCCVNFLSPAPLPTWQVFCHEIRRAVLSDKKRSLKSLPSTAKLTPTRFVSWSNFGVVRGVVLPGCSMKHSTYFLCLHAPGIRRDVETFFFRFCFVSVVTRVRMQKVNAQTFFWHDIVEMRERLRVWEKHIWCFVQLIRVYGFRTVLYVHWEIGRDCLIQNECTEISVDLYINNNVHTGCFM